MTCNRCRVGLTRLIGMVGPSGAVFGGSDDVRHIVRSQVAGRQPVDQRERLSIERFLIEFDRLVSPFDENADPVHVTASAIVTGRRGVLLHRHRRLGIWLQPGGHVDAGEVPWDAACREALEETGLRVGLRRVGGAPSVPRLAHVDVHPGPRGHTHLDLRYLVDGGDADPDPPPGESPQVEWFDWDRAIEIADPGLRGALVALRSDA